MNIVLGSIPEGRDFPDEVRENVRQAAEKVMELYGLPHAEVSISMTDNAHIRQLNKKYRHLDRPTDVLSFAFRESAEPVAREGPDADLLGDIIISVERAREQAEEYGHSLRRELAFLTVHGMLHLLGYDHIEDDERKEMEEEQKYIMGQLGIHRLAAP